jgi:hypothetical protein
MGRQTKIEPERTSIHTTVLKMTPNTGHWFITAFQNSRVQYIGRPQEIQTLTEELRKELEQRLQNKFTILSLPYMFLNCCCDYITS